VRVLLWPVHGGYTNALVRGDHEYLLPVAADPGERDTGLDGWGWTRTRQVPLDRLREEQIDVVVLQSADEIDRVEELTGRAPGRDVPAVYLEHNTPRPEAVATEHPLAGRSDIPIVHVTYFNELFWDNGRAPTVVVEHGVPDPGPLYTGELARTGVVINEPVRRWRVTGTDLLPAFSREAPVDVFGMAGEQLAGVFAPGHDVHAAGDLPFARMHAELARRRVYLHPFRWTSLGLSLLEAMHLGMPVVGLATTEMVRAVPAGVGVISTDVDELRLALRAFLADADLARDVGRRAREHALGRYGLAAFLTRWDEVFEDVVASHSAVAARLDRRTA
jgi:glycosyltransferase involved in cell wall biosynthesis